MLILASSSPRRKELLKKLTNDFTIIVPDIDESIVKVDGSQLPLEESKLKAYAIAASHPNDEVLACDTVVLLDGKVLGKPHTEEKAIEMLKEESGKKQVVLSAYTYIGKGMEVNRTVKTEVYFNHLSEEQIKNYVKEKSPLDKAGAYGIQDECGLISSIVGSYDNVMGLPVEDIAKHTPIEKNR